MIHDARQPHAALRDPAPDRRRCITQGVLAAAREVAESCRATAILADLDAPQGERLELPAGSARRVIRIVRTAAESRAAGDDDAVHVPDLPLTRMGQVKVAVFMALSRGLIHRGDVLVCLSGVAGSGTLDTLVVVDVDREYEMILTSPDGQLLPPGVCPGVIERVIAIAAELGSEGREGRPVGAVFVVGDTERVVRMSRQMILNPFQGYPDHQRRLDDPYLEETIKELSILDGAFIVRGDGVVEACGALLEVANHPSLDLPQGLGTRHHAAAAITAATGSVAVAISESTGSVTIFRGGKIVTALKRPRGGTAVYPEAD